MDFLWYNKLLFIHSVTKKYNFINIAKNWSKLFAQNVWDFAQIFDESNLLGMRLYPQHLQHSVGVFATLNQ